MAELAAVQRWMQRALFAGGASPDHAGEVVARQGALTPAQRVGIYAGGYRARLTQCLEGDYPALKLLAGETGFDLFARGYIAASPSRRPSLYDFGAGFAGWLERTAPAGDREFAIPAQLARLERARNEAVRAVGVESDRAPVTGDLAIVPGSRLRLPDSVRLLRLDFDFAPLLAAAERGEPAPAPGPADAFVAVARFAWRVRVHSLEPWQYAFLEALPGCGGDVHAAAAAAAKASGREAGAILADLILWLPAAGAAGLLARG